MNVSVSGLRADLAAWIRRAQRGEDVVVTDRGAPVARLVALDWSPVLADLEARGLVTRPRRSDRPPATGTRRVRASGPVADLVTDDRER